MIPVLEREIIRKREWTTLDEVMEYYTIAQVTPGIIGVNISTFIGYKQKGPLGGALATVGFVLPGVFCAGCIAFGLRNVTEYPAVRHILGGIRVAVGALIIDTAAKLLKGTFKDPKGIGIFILAFALSAIWSAHPILIITAAGGVGFLLYRPKKTDAPPDKKYPPL
jgi:chromate transporter